MNAIPKSLIINTLKPYKEIHYLNPHTNKPTTLKIEDIIANLNNNTYHLISNDDFSLINELYNRLNNLTIDYRIEVLMVKSIENSNITLDLSAILNLEIKLV